MLFISMTEPKVARGNVVSVYFPS